MTRPASIAMMIVLLLGLVACGSAPAQKDRYFRPALSLPQPHAPLPVRLVVEPFEVHGLYSDRPLVYLDREGAYQQSNHNSWIEPPSVLLASGLLETLRAAYGQESVFLPDARVSGDVRIRTRLRRLERIPEREQALLSLDIIVTSHGGDLIGSVDFEESAPSGRSTADYVQAQGVLLGRAYARLLVLLDQRVAAAPGAH